MAPASSTTKSAGVLLSDLIIKLYYEYLGAKKQGNTLTQLNTNVKPTLKHFQNLPLETRINLSFLGFIFGFVLFILPINIIVKIILAGTLSLLVTIPLLSQFFFFSMPILAWVFLFFSAAKIPIGLKPPISVKFLPAMETILYGDDLSNILASYTNVFLDIFAWLPYGIIHFAGPFVVAALIWLFGPPTALRSFGWAFGYMSLTGVIIQMLLPAAPPWYKNLYGLQPAHYDMNGSPGGLGRMDGYFGFDMYTTAFSTAPVIFGALPSLHSGMSTMSALWLHYLFPQGKTFFVVYVCWLWWSTMYLTHHYFFDLTAGSVLAVSFFYYAKFKWLPVKRDDCFCRFNYTSIELENLAASDPLNTDGFTINLDSQDVELSDVLDSSSTGQSTPIMEEGPASTPATSIMNI